MHFVRRLTVISDRQLACESKLVTDVNNITLKVAALRTSIRAGTALVRCLKAELANLKATLAEDLKMELVALLLISPSAWTVFS